MKIYSRQDFMLLPAGVIYSKGQQWYFNQLYVKGDTIFDGDEPIDWGKRNLIQNIASYDVHGRYTEWPYDEMLEKGTSHLLDDAYGRDGCFDDTEVFLVYEIPDLVELLKVIEVAGKVSHEVV